MEPRIQTLMEQVNTKRSSLVEGAWSKYCTSLPEATPEWEKGNLAQVLENQAKFFASQGISLSEDTTTGSVAGFEKFIFPMIRTVWPNLVSTELVSVQVMDGPVSMLFYMDFVAGTTKGGITAGDSLASPRTGMAEDAYKYSSETIENELLDASQAGNTGVHVEYPLSYSPVRPGSCTITWTEGVTSYSMTDNGGGSFPVAGAVISAEINYAVGRIDLDLTTGTTFLNISATYDYNSEGSDKVPILDLELTSAPVASRPDKIRARWSAEAAAMVRAVHGIDAELELTEALAQQIRFSIDNTIINDLWRIAAAGSVSFDANPPANVPFYTHQLGLKRTLQSGANAVFKATRQGFANWIVAGVDAASFIESHPQFESSGMVNGPGVTFAGVFANTWKVFKNPFLTSTTGFSSSDFLMGFKGNAFYNSGYIYAPWIPFFATPTVMLDDMVMRKAVMTHYAKKAVNGLYYCKGSILHA